ncbi:hypothetical protein Taro_053433, partial [Colocasia esculenta]|nr:hypothetical protein [Colocasia esculenta]
GQTREQPFPLLFLLFFSFSIFVRFHSFRWLTGSRGKTLVREAELDRAENIGSGGGFREEASKGSTRIEVWQDFLHASEHCLVALLLVGVTCLTGSLFVRLTPFPSGGSWSAFEVRGVVSLRGWSRLA